MGIIRAGVLWFVVFCVVDFIALVWLLCNTFDDPEELDTEVQRVHEAGVALWKATGIESLIQRLLNWLLSRI